MADPLTNGTSTAMGDVEMKEEAPVEAPLDSIQQTPDPTDPQPPPQIESQPLPIHAEHLSTIQPGPPVPPAAAATPPTHSGANTRPGSMPPQPSARPEKPVAHGGPTRQYLNHNVTPHLLEAMKHLAVNEPDKPLLWLSNFLRDRSKDVEG